MDEDQVMIPPDCVSSLGHSRTIVHIDADCFYAQVEMLENPELRGKPLGVQQKNIVVTCNYVAREKGVSKLMLVAEARKLCPGLVLVNGEDLARYRVVSDRVTDLLQSRFSSLVERLGLDENFVDVSEMVKARTPTAQVAGHVYGDLVREEEEQGLECHCGCDQRVKIGSQVAQVMREAIREEVGLTTCAGVSFNKMLAKLVGSQHKPNQQTTLFSWQAQKLLSSLPGGVRAIPGIGRQMSDLLKSGGISSLCDLQQAGLDTLTTIFGNRDRASVVQKLAFGVDDTPVKPSGRPKSLGIEDAVKGVNCAQDAEAKIEALSGRLLDLLTAQQDGRLPGTVRLTVRKWDKATKEARRESRQAAMPALPPLHSETFRASSLAKMMPLLKELFAKMVPDKNEFHLTLLGVAFTNFCDRKSGKGSISSFLQPVAKKARLDATGVEASTSHVLLPPEVDRDVFNALPAEMQEEILADWKNRQQTLPSPTKAKKKCTINDYFGKKK
ncbi:DNA polymerase iota [Cloeon dipterum]|uniref:DNA polymerase iota n=1 Tax=Cloeon dipterum TaxID=197152 RepID=UPI00321FA6B0